MAFASKSEQRLRGSMDYKASEAELNRESYKKVGNMGSKSDRLVGNLASGSAKQQLYGAGLAKASMRSGLAGNMSGDGYPGGPRWKKAMEPGEFQPGSYAQAKNTTRMTPGKGDKSTVMKVTSVTPKALRGGSGR